MKNSLLAVLLSALLAVAGFAVTQDVRADESPPTLAAKTEKVIAYNKAPANVIAAISQYSLDISRENAASPAILNTGRDPIEVLNAYYAPAYTERFSPPDKRILDQRQHIIAGIGHNRAREKV